MVEVATLEMTARTDGLTKAEAALASLKQAAAQTEAATTKLATGSEAVSKSFIGASGNTRMFVQQLSQVAQQGVATGQWAQAFSVQAADIGMAFGAAGAAIGTVATIALPILLSQLGQLIPQTITAKDAMQQLSDAQSGLKSTQDILSLSFADLTEKYGAYAVKVREAAQALAELQIAQANADLSNTLKSANSELDYLLTNTRTGYAYIRNTFDVTEQQVQQLAIRFRDVRDAATLQDKLAAFNALSSYMKAIGVDTATIPVSLRQAMTEGNQLLIQMAQLQTQADATANSAAKIPASFRGGTVTSLYSQLVAAGGMNNTGTTGTIGGGGAAQTDTLQTQLEALQRSLMSKEEIENASYARSQATLSAALAARKITQDQYNSLTEQEWQAHNDRLAQIDVYRYGTGLEQASAFFGTMQSTFQSGGEGMVRIARIFGAAHALINAWEAYTVQLKNPTTLTVWGRLAGAASILSAGLGAVNAIKSGSTSAAKASSGSVGSTSSTSTASAQKTITVQIQGDTAYANLLRQNISVIAEALQAESGIGGFVVA